VTAAGVVLAAVVGGLFVYFKPSEHQVTNSDKYQELERAKKEQDAQISDLRAELQGLKNRSDATANQKSASLIEQLRVELVSLTAKSGESSRKLADATAAHEREVAALKQQLSALQGASTRPGSAGQPASRESVPPNVQRVGLTLLTGVRQRVGDDLTIVMNKFIPDQGPHLVVNGSGVNALPLGGRFQTSFSSSQTCFIEIAAYPPPGQSSPLQVDYVCKVR
jgi:hypothetical protein